MGTEDDRKGILKEEKLGREGNTCLHLSMMFSGHVQNASGSNLNFRRHRLQIFVIMCFLFLSKF